MKRWLIQLVVLLSLSARLLRADYTSTPLDAAVPQQLPYEYAGIIVSYWDSVAGTGARGSGAVVGNPKIVISCAHLPFNNDIPNSIVWVTDNLWFRAYHSSTPLTRAAGQPLRGYWKFASYADMVAAHGQDTAEAFAVDFTAHYAYEDLGPGNAGLWYDGQAALVSPTGKIIVGYPSGLYTSGDSRRNLMHQAGPFNLAFAQSRNSYNRLEGVSTGPGNSGGPVFVTDENSLTDADQGLRFAAVLVSGLETSEGDSKNLVGVVAVTAPEWDLVNESLNAIGAVPLNDAWSSALTISGDTATSTASNQHAMKEPGEPNHAGNAGGHSLWWRWTAPGDGPVTVNTSGNDFDTLLGVYTGGGVGSLTAVASNDDNGAANSSAATFAAVAGTEYWIAVDGKNGATGATTVNLSFAPTVAPANDAFANATMISGLSAQVIGNNINATKEPGEPDFRYTDGSGLTTPGGKSVWWKWTAPAGGQVFLSTAGTNFDTLLSVYTGTAVNALTLVASNDNPAGSYSDSSTLTFSATSGTTYWFLVQAWSDATHPAASGAISLSLNLTPTVPIIAVQPATQTPGLGEAAVLAVAARGAGSLSYQWYKDGVAIGGATGPRFTIGSFQPADTGTYTVVVTNPSGSATSSLATLTPRGYPVITSQPASQMITAGSTATLSVAATSGTALTYQWRKDGSNLADGGRISGSTGATLTISSAQTADAGSYRVVVTNAAGSTGSTAATLTVIPVLPSGGVVSISAGGSHTLFVGSDGSLWAVGNNDYGQLGDGTNASKSRPVQIATGVAAASAGESHSLFIKSDGTLWAMGSNGAGQLGDSLNFGNRWSPAQIATGVVAASAGLYHSLFIKSDGTLWAMGNNINGQLGDGTMTNHPTPVQVASGVIAISAGGYHSLFIKSDGALWAMGRDMDGQLGDGTTTNRATPFQVVSGVTGAWAAFGHSLFTKTDGTLWAMGQNYAGQLGDGTTFSRNVPVQVATNVTAADGGGAQSLFLRLNGTLWGMGYNGDGELGDGTTSYRYSPIQIAEGALVLSAGGTHSVFLRSDGLVWATGFNNSGQLGDGTTTMRTRPVPVIGGTALSPFAPAGLTASSGSVVGAVRLSWNPTVGAARYEIWRSASNDFSAATSIASNVTSAIYFDRTGTVGTTYFYWVKAANQAGAGGASDARPGYSVPWIAPAIGTQPTDQTVNIGEHTSFTITASGDPPPTLQWQRFPAGGTAWSDLVESIIYDGVSTTTLTVHNTTYAMNGDLFRCVATNIGGQANSNPAMLTVNPVAGVVAAEAGGAHSLLLRADGTLWAAGWNVDGELGDGTRTARTTPVQIAAGVVAASAGANHSAFIRTDGTLWTTGSNSYGQLGDGTNTDRASPVQVASGVVAVAAGCFHTMFVKTDGTLWGTGFNGSGQLGDGTTINRASPVKVSDAVLAVAAGQLHSLFIKFDGTLWAMGSNSSGQLGDGTFQDRHSPVLVADGVVATAAGESFSLFIRSDGTLWAMGANYSGQLGDGTAVSRASPVKVASGVVAAAAGANHSLFVKADGTAWAMGDGAFGQLGDGVVNQANPIQVAADVAAVSAGGYYSLFAKTDGTLWAAGKNSFGQLGDGTTVNRLSSVAVAGGLPRLPASPAGLLASDGTVSCNVLLAWTPVAGAAHYEVWRNSVNNVGGASLIASNVTHALYADSTAEPVTVLYYWVKAVNFAGMSEFGGSDSGYVPLIAPTVTRQPAAQLAVSGQTAWFSVAVAASPRPSFQWQCSANQGSAWSDLANDTVYSGVTTAMLAIANTTTAMRGNQFRCVTGNRAGSVTTVPAILTVDPALVVTTLAGQADSSGNADGTGSAAQFWSPSEAAIDGAGNLYVADTNNHTIRKVTPAGVVTTLAGGYPGSSDGTGSAARFFYPRGVATDSTGVLYVVDTQNCTIRRVTPAGVVTTLAGSASQAGPTDGTGTAARFNYPTGAAIDRAGNVYVADSNSNTIRRVTPAGVVTTLAGQAGVPGSADGTGAAAQFHSPTGVATDRADNLYVADTNNHTIRKVTPAGVVTTLAGQAGVAGSTDGAGSAARFYTPTGLAADSAGVVFVTDGNCTIRKITPDGVVTTVAGSLLPGNSDGTGSAARFGSIKNWIAASQTGYVYIVDSANSTIRKGVLEGVPVFTAQPADQPVTAGQNASFTATATGIGSLSFQWQRSVDSGNTWSDLANGGSYAGVGTTTLTISNATSGMNGDLFRCVASDSLTLSTTSIPAALTVLPVPAAPPAGAGESVLSSGFTAGWSSVSGATGYRLDVSTSSSFGSFVSGYQDLDVGNATSKVLSGLSANTTYYYRVRAYNSAGTGANSSTVSVTTSAPIVITAPLTVSTLAGQPLSNGNSDGAGSAARFFYLSGITADNAGNLYVADTDNHTIRKIVASTGAVSTLAGAAGSPGSSDGTGTAARFNNPSSVAVDGTGNVYVADTLNHTLRKVTTSGVVTTLAGSPGTAGSADGTGSAARFQGPQGLAIDAGSNLYVADTNNHTIRKMVPSTGVVTTVAGLAGNSGSADGLGSLGRFDYPSGVAIDGAGNLFVADTENHTVRRILPSGLVSTLAGLAGASGGADGTGSAARFDSPSDLAVDSSGSLYVADTDNFTIRKVDATTGAVSTLAGLAGTSGSADGVGSAVRFFGPAGIAVDSNSNLYVADTNNHTVRVGLLATAPAIQTQPQSQTVNAGSSVQFTVTATGRPAVTYQWYFGGTAISGATGSSYNLSNVQSGNAGNYTVVVSNILNSVTSNAATLTVNASTPPLEPPSGGGGGGGGAPSVWFCSALVLFVLVRRLQGRPKASVAPASESAD